MILTLKRVILHPNYTEGTLFVDGLYFCDTIEDRFRDLSKEAKIPGKTAIPYGVYPVKLTFSQRFKKVMPLIENVPNFTGIRIHSGNTAADTEGCILIGDHLSPGKIGLSRDTFMRLMNVLEHATKVKNETVKIEIK